MEKNLHLISLLFNVYTHLCSPSIKAQTIFDLVLTNMNFY